MGKFISYVRVSTNGQADSGLGIEAQQAAVRHYVERSNGEIIQQFVEVESGRRNDRPQLDNAIRAARLTGARLLIAKLDRLSRSVFFVSGLLESRVKFTAVDVPEADETTIHLFATLAEREAKMISLRTKAALAAKKARGDTLGNPNLANIRNSDVTRANEARFAKAEAWKAEIRSLIHEAGIAGKSLRTIANWLNERGYETRRGGQFTAAAVSRVLK